jgi:hypothetical protein
MKRIELADVIKLIRKEYDLPKDKYSVIPRVTFDDMGDGIQYEDIYFDVYLKQPWQQEGEG